MKSASESQKICVMGLGYIGLPTASLLATKGFEVVGVDVSQEVVDTINQGEIHIVEPDLDVLVKSAVFSGNLSASLEPCEADVFLWMCIVNWPKLLRVWKKSEILYPRCS